MNPDVTTRVRQVIDASGITHREMAQRMATTSDKLSKSLSGVRRFTATELAVLAEHGGTTVDWLLTGREAPAPRRAARSAVSGLEPEHVDALAARFADASHQLERIDGFRTLVALPALVESWSFVEEGTALASSALARCAKAGVDVVGSADLVGELERVFDVDVAVVDLPDALDGVAWCHESLRLILLARTSVFARQRFTVAHELGHVLAGDAQTLLAERDVAQVPADVSAADARTEKRANAFAAALLMPEQRVVAAVGGAVLDREVFASLVSAFQVSPAAMAWRLVNLHLAEWSTVEPWSRSTTEACMTSTGRTAAFRAAREDARAERLPLRLVDGHLARFLEGRTSARPLASLMGEDVETVIGWRSPPAARASADVAHQR